MTLKLKFHDFRQITRSETLDEPTQLGEVIYREAVKLLETHHLRSKVRLIGVGVWNLEPLGPPAQMSLFRESKPSIEKWEKVEQATDEIARRFGDDAVKRGRLREE